MSRGSGKGSMEEVEIRALGAGGVGIGSMHDGKVVFLPRTAPGDRVMARPVQVKERWVRGEVAELLSPGPGRRAPPCPRFAECDGCSLQHLEYPEQLRWKGRIVADALQRIGGMAGIDPDVEPSPKQLRYRNKITFTLRRLSGGRVVAGFRALQNRKRVLDIGPECLLPEEGLDLAWEALRKGWGPNANLLPEGGELRLTLRKGEEGVALLVKGGLGDGRPQSLLEQVPLLNSIWRESNGESAKHLAGSETVQVLWRQDRLELTGGGFVQVNTAAGETLHDYVLREVGEVGGQRIIDAYCGVGALGKVLARGGGKVWGIDLDPDSIAAAKVPALEGFDLIQGSVEDNLEPLLPADVVLLNPPRTGIHATVAEKLQGQPPATLMYVSCDPATLARDLSRMADAFALDRVRCFDLFPQTGHVETVVTMKRKESPTA